MRSLAALASVATLALAPASAADRSGVTALRPCGAHSRVLCGSIVVPLDPTGRVAGAVRLHLEELPPRSGAAAASAPLVFLVAGGPGQGSAQAFDLRRHGADFQRIFPGYTLVTYDDRGTGRSGPARCAALAAPAPSSGGRARDPVAACGRELGKGGRFYATWVNAADLDAVRAALGADRIALYGVSYGTKQVLTYAYEHPKHVRAVVLDSVAPLNGDLFGLAPLRALPHVLDELCRTGCNGVTHHAGADFATLANRLDASPVDATVARPGARAAHVQLTGRGLLELGYETDLNPGIAAELPAAVRAGLDGDLLPLERLLLSTYRHSTGLP